MEGHGLQAISIGFLIDVDTPMVWRGPMVTQALEQLLKDTNWRDLDYLVVDLPPGTGDIQLTLAQKVPVTGAVIVTTPQDIALIDARKGLKMFEKVGIPILGMVENMSFHLCPKCGHESHIFGDGRRARRCAKDYGTELLGQLPLDEAIRSQADSGKPTVVSDPDGAVAADLPPDRAPLRGQDRGVAARHDLQVPQHRGAEHLMPIKSDRWIRRMAEEHRMIEPFEPDQVKEVAGRRVVSYGTSSYGYDIRCSTEFKIFTNINSTIVDPKAFDEKNFVDYRGDVCIIPPNSFALARTVEYFRIPRSVLTICLGKSTYARCGIIVNVTPLEPEWEGHVTLEFSNTTPLPARIYANEGVAQVLFIESDEVVRDLLSRPRRQVPGTEGRHASPDLNSGKKALDAGGHVPIIRSSFFLLISERNRRSS